MEIYVAYAAYQFESGRIFAVPRPGRHHTVIALMCQAIKVETLIGYEEEMTSGFLLNTGKFVGREEAAMVAFNAGQLIKDRLKERGQDPDCCPERLFSEDVW